MADADALAIYKQKRNFDITSEPAEGGAPGTEALQFVIQKHWASRLHYDLRLEIDGTMKSWAVPKGPSLDPADKRMAVQVEDHPIAYNTYEGEIPPKQYGAGKVIVWDKGYWIPEADPAAGWHAGKLKFALAGHKLQGHWTLVRMQGHGADKQAPWLLIKEKDNQARPAGEFSVVEAMPDSVKALPAVALPARASAVRKMPAAAPRNAAASGNRADLPPTLSPQLATLVDGPPADATDWLFELKFDGYRLVARIDGQSVQLFTRAGNDWTHKMPGLVEALRTLPLRSGWLDGEIIVAGADGVPDFQSLQNAFDGAGTRNIVYYVFDLPFLDGRDLRSLPLVERREVLRGVVAGHEGSVVRFSEAFDAPPADLVASACRIGFEGVIGKRRNGTYVSRRSPDWIKLKCSHRQEFVIGGYTDPKGSRTGIGSLLLGVHDAEGELRYAGNVGTGFSERTLAELEKQLAALVTETKPFADAARDIGKKAHWVRPTLLAEVSFAEWTGTHRIRHSVFHGLRSDKPVKAIVREEPRHMQDVKTTATAADGADSSTVSATPASKPARQGLAKGSKAPAVAAPPLPSGLRVSHPERVIDRTTGTTKLDLVHYYAKVAAVMMPHLLGRPVALVRAPGGVDGEMFFQKHEERSRMPGIAQLDPALYAGHPPMLEVASGEGLLSAAQMNVIEFHTWNARKDKIHRPDRMAFDLDPGEGVDWQQIQEDARLVKVLLEQLGLPSFLKTSGGKGLHVVVPLKRLHDWDTVRGFSEAVVQHLSDTIPARFVVKSGPRNRVGKVFVDYLRNGWGATTACAWSARARHGMGISVPVTWDELESLIGGAHWTVQTVDGRLASGNTPWDGYDKAAVSLTQAMKQLGWTLKSS